MRLWLREPFGVMNFQHQLPLIRSRPGVLIVGHQCLVVDKGHRGIGVVAPLPILNILNVDPGLAPVARDGTAEQIPGVVKRTVPVVRIQILVTVLTRRRHREGQCVVPDKQQLASLGIPPQERR